jgi:hypothetical protein
MRLNSRSVFAFAAALALTVAGPGCSDDESSGGGGSGAETPGGGGAGGGTGGAPEGGQGGTGGNEASPESDEVEVRLALRGLFEDRVVWTRAYLVDSIDDLPGRELSAARLLQNGEDFGAAVAPFYGADAGDQLASLMNAAVGHAATAVDAAIAGDQAGFAAAREDWYGSADDVAALLASANPVWIEADVSMMLRSCIDDAVAEAMGRMQGDHEAEIAAFDAHKVTSFAVADALAGGLAAQFPDKVGPKGTTDKQQELRVAMRSLFFDRSAFVRFFLTDTIEGLSSQPQTVARLMQNNQDIGQAIAPFYGEPAAAQLSDLLDAGLGDAAAAVTAAMNDDAVAFEAAKNSWYGHADETAEFLASANPNWPVDALKTMLHACVDDALAEASARLSDDWEADVSAHDTLRAQARSVADALGNGVALQFP